ncbi:hypothetical protein [Nocardia brasiliensis]|uniref:hypothetical protein n=1 Tax=Nocardia brasiliensis TaxID=37326 RepID=UPI002457A22C|nr:hypothetical protein [Nocardia brasiliensis]
MSITLLVREVVVAQAPTPAPGNNSKIPVTIVAPPNADKFQLLLGVGLWLSFVAIIAFGIISGIKLAQSFVDGQASFSGKVAPLGAAVGAIISGTAATWVSFFL